MLLRERVERRVDAAVTAAMVGASVSRAMGSDVEMPDGPALVDEAMDRFDAMLVAPPEQVTTDPEQYTLMRALGLRE